MQGGCDNQRLEHRDFAAQRRRIVMGVRVQHNLCNFENPSKVWCNILFPIRHNFATCYLQFGNFCNILNPCLQLSKCATCILFATFTTLQYIFAHFSLARNFENFATYCLHFWNLAQSVAYLLAQCPCCGCNVMRRWCLWWRLTSLSFDNITLSRKKQQHLHLVINQEYQHYEDVWLIVDCCPRSNQSAMFHGTKDFWPVASWWFRAKFQTSWAMGRDSSNLGLESQPAIRMLIYSQLGSNRVPQGMEHGTRPQFCIIPLQFQWKCCHNPALKLCLLFDTQWDRKSKMSKEVFSERNNEGLQTMIAHVLNTFTKYVGLLLWILEVSVIRNQPSPFCERPVIEKFLEEGLFAFLPAEKLQVRF